MAAVRYFVEKGADKDKCSLVRFSPLIQATTKGFMDIVQYLQEQGCSPVDDNGRTVLHGAAYGGQLVLCQQLVEQGADLEAVDKYDNTPLHTCIALRHLAVARYLVVQGSNKDAAGQCGKTPLHISVENGMLSFVRFLHQQGADVDKVNDEGQTPLHVAAERDELEVMQYLLEEGGVDRNKATTTTQDTALHIAAAAGHDEIVTLLFTHLADLTARNRNGQLPIDVAKNDKICQLIAADEVSGRDHGHKRAREEDMVTPEPQAKKQAVKPKGDEEVEEEEDQPSEASDEDGEQT